MVSQGNVYALGPTRDWWIALRAAVLHGASPTPLLAELQRKADGYSACLAASRDYQTGDAEQKAQAQTACAERR